MNRQPALLILGPTASGKTPLGEMIQEHGLWKARCAHFDFGANLREVVQQNRPNDRITREDIDFLRHVLETNALLEDEHFLLARQILEAFLSRRGAGKLVILNGLPRHVGQAEGVRSLLDVQTIVHLHCSEETVLARIHTNAGGDRTDRGDDDMASVRNKLAMFHQRTAPLIDHYRGHGADIMEIEVTADMTPEQAWRMLELSRR